MTDPNIAYKRAFAELTRELGHSPTPRDDGWLRLGNELSRSWGPAEEILVKPRRRPEQTGFSRQQAPQARTLDARARDWAESAEERPARLIATEPLSGPTVNSPRAEAESPPRPASSSPRPSEGPNIHSLTVGSRGPSGGIVAECRKCGGVWERPKLRGKPNALCGECR